MTDLCKALRSEVATQDCMVEDCPGSRLAVYSPLCAVCLAKVYDQGESHCRVTGYWLGAVLLRLEAKA